jgi:hypothetical protein
MSSKSGTLDIAKKTLTVGWEITDLATNKTASLTAGSAFTYNAIGYQTVANLIGVVSGETVNVTYSGATEGKNVNSYTTTASLSTASYPNYTLATSSISWKIDPYKIDFKWSFNGKEEEIKALENETEGDNDAGKSAKSVSSDNLGGLSAAFDNAFANVEWQPGN